MKDPTAHTTLMNEYMGGGGFGGEKDIYTKHKVSMIIFKIFYIYIEQK